jgi:hypothetical protein
MTNASPTRRGDTLASQSLPNTSNSWIYGTVAPIQR